MNRILFFIIFLIANVSMAQVKSQYGVEVIEKRKTYRKQVKENPHHKFIDLSTIQGLYFDIRYATTNNFTGEIIYPEAKAYARVEVAKALANVVKQLRKSGLALKVFDAYRPYDATVKFYEIYKDTTYVASPYSGSRHNRGCAIDLTLIKLNGEEVPMPTSYDDFSQKAQPDYENLPQRIKQNRDFLIQVMEENGFTVYPSEWWHFDFNQWEEYPIMNLSFETLKQAQ